MLFFSFPNYKYLDGTELPMHAKFHVFILIEGCSFCFYFAIPNYFHLFVYFSDTVIKQNLNSLRFVQSVCDTRMNCLLDGQTDPDLQNEVSWKIIFSKLIISQKIIHSL